MQMKQDFNSIKSNTDGRKESGWFVLLFFKFMWASFWKEHINEIEEKNGVRTTWKKDNLSTIYRIWQYVNNSNKDLLIRIE